MAPGRDRLARGAKASSAAAAIALVATALTPSPADATHDVILATELELPGVAEDTVIDNARGQAYVSIPERKKVAVVSLPTLELTDLLPAGGEARGMDLSHDGSTLYVALEGIGSVASLNLETRTRSIADYTTELDDPRTWDVIEARPGRLFVSSSPGSNGFAYIVMVKTDQGNAASRVADGRIIRAGPRFAVSPDQESMYIGEGFRPNSLYKLDITDDLAPIVGEDDHGSVDGTQPPTVLPDGTRIHVNSGQILSHRTLKETGHIGRGRAVFSSDSSLAYVAPDPRTIQTWDMRSFEMIDQVHSTCGGSSVSAIHLLDNESTVLITAGDRVCSVSMTDDDECLVSGLALPERSPPDRSPTPNVELAAAVADQLTAPRTPDAAFPSRRRSGGLTDGRLRALDSGPGEPSEGYVWRGDHVVVEIGSNLPAPALAELVAAVGGTVHGGVPGLLAEAAVPVDSLALLERLPGVDFVRTPLSVNAVPDEPAAESSPLPRSTIEVVGDEVAASLVEPWHCAGLIGEGVSIGIIDVFDADRWNEATALYEIPRPAGSFCLRYGSPCNIFTRSSVGAHGVAVAEVLHDVAPGADLYLARAHTASDLQAAIDYFAAEGVDVVTRSLVDAYESPGDGTGPINAIIDSAVAAGMVYFSPAGNHAGLEDVHFGQYWRGEWSDPNQNGWLNFSPNDELMGFVCSYSHGLRWSDFGAAAPTDYDVYIFDEPDDPEPETWSTNDQQSGAEPLEHAQPECSLPFDVDYLAIQLFDPGSGTASDQLEFAVGGSALEYWQNEHSASTPGVDSSSAGAMAIGAIDPAGGTTIASYSSRGPTNDFRHKPDAVAPSCVQTYTFGPDCFAGTSAAAPAAAGLAALIMSAGEATTPTEVKAYLLGSAVDLGPPGFDSTYGAGLLVLPPPPGTEPPPGGDAVHVSSLRFVVQTSKDRAVGKVFVEDQNGTRVPGAAVTAEWSIDGAAQGPSAKNSNGSGVASFILPGPPPGAALEICVADIIASGYDYDPAANTATCASGTWPGEPPPAAILRSRFTSSGVLTGARFFPTAG